MNLQKRNRFTTLRTNVWLQMGRMGEMIESFGWMCTHYYVQNGK